MAQSEQYVAAGQSGTVAGRVGVGTIAGIGGGIIFGILMGMMGMLPMVAMLVGSNDAVVGAIVHLIISAAIGAVYGIVFGSIGATPSKGWATGLAYGFSWWILGPQVIMPTMLGMGLQFGAAFSGPMLMSLMGHLIYGVVAGLVYPLAAKRVG